MNLLEDIIVIDFSQFLSGPSAGLRLADMGGRRVFRIEAEKKHVTVNKVIIEPPEAFDPFFLHDQVRDVVIARDVKERHFQLLHESHELLPLSINLLTVFRVAHDQVSNAHHELRLQQVDFSNRILKHTGPHAARAVGHDYEMKCVRLIVKGQPSPGIGGGIDPSLAEVPCAASAANRQQQGNPTTGTPTQTS